MISLLKIYKFSFRNAASKDWVYQVQGYCIIWTNVGILLIEPLGTNFNEILIEIYTFSFKEMHLKMSSGKWQPFVLASMCWHKGCWCSGSFFLPLFHQQRLYCEMVLVVHVDGFSDVQISVLRSDRKFKCIFMIPKNKFNTTVDGTTRLRHNLNGIHLW